MANTFFKRSSDVKRILPQDSQLEQRLTLQKNSDFLSDHVLSLTPIQKSAFQNPQHTKRSSQRALVDVGGYGDCGFRALAAGILDNVLLNKALLANKKLIVTLFAAYDHYFSADLSQPGDPYERLKHMFAVSAQRSELIIRLAYVLRQIAVSEMVSHPEHYPGAFIQDHEGTSPEDMRKPTTWIDESAIAALSNVLHLPVCVYAIESNKELANRIVYQPQSVKEHQDLPDPVVIQLASGHYQPLVKQSEVFQLNDISSRSILTSTVEHHDPQMTEILEKIKIHEEKVLTTFSHFYDELTNLLIDKKLDKAQLLSIYIAGMNNSDYLQRFSCHLDLHRRYFENTLHEAKAGVSVNKPNETQENYVVERLIHAIARAVAIGHLDRHCMDCVLEDKPSSSMMLRP